LIKKIKNLNITPENIDIIYGVKHQDEYKEFHFVLNEYIKHPNYEDWVAVISIKDNEQTYYFRFFKMLKNISTHEQKLN
jgi:hypothetical protein